MLDEIDSRFWVANHEAFGREMDAALASLGALLSRAARSGTGQLFAAVAAFAVTAFTFNAAAFV